MKTIGERIKQARNAKHWSAETLALAAGYKNQSAIGNLENRVGGSGGNKIGEIARILSVSVDWLMNGPDTDQVPFLPQQIDVTRAQGKSNTAEPQGSPLYSVNTQTIWPFELFDHADWMLLGTKDREEFENLIAGAILRARKMRSGT